MSPGNLLQIALDIVGRMAHLPGPGASGGGLFLAGNQSLNERVRLGGLRGRGQDRLLVIFKDFHP